MVGMAAMLTILCVPGAPPDYPASVRLPVANDDITLHVSFDYGDALPDRAVNPAGVVVKGTPRFAAGLRGRALVMGPKGASCAYPVAGNLDVGRPGAISIWVRPVDWPYGNDEPTTRYWSTAYWGRGYLGLQRQGRIVKQGLVRRQAALHLFMHYFKGVKSTSFSIGKSRLAPNRWHLMVVQWRGRRFEGSLNGGPPNGTELPRPLRTEELNRLLHVGDASRWTTLLDELTVYRRTLSAEEIQQLYGGRPKSRPRAGSREGKR